MKFFSNDPKKTRTYSGKLSKQSSWFKVDKDIIFEDSFKYWFALMWQNKYLHIGVVGFIATIIELFKYNDLVDTFYKNMHADGFLGGLFTFFGCIILPAMFLVVLYKGWWQYFDDMKKGISR
jgi:hypothetical protein